MFWWIIKNKKDGISKLWITWQIQWNHNNKLVSLIKSHNIGKIVVRNKKMLNNKNKSHNHLKRQADKVKEENQNNNNLQRKSWFNKLFKLLLFLLEFYLHIKSTSIKPNFNHLSKLYKPNLKHILIF
jgi:hypothetical protein